jgi:ABC-type Fe3+-hydroxamate transport system substrate-binding protein
MTVGGDTFIHAMLEKAGLINVFGNESRYPCITIEEIKAAKPAVVLLSSEPFPFTQKHADEFAKYLPGSKVLVADGEMFGWYGSRLLRSCHYFKELLSLI